MPLCTDDAGFTMVGLCQVIVQTHVTVEETISTLALHVIREPYLQTRRRMVRIVGAGMSVLVVVGFEGACTEITVAKETQ